MTIADAPNPDTVPKYAWRLLRAGPLHLDGGSMFGVIPRAVWSRTIVCDEQGRIELAHNCLLLRRAPANQASSTDVESASRTPSSPLETTVHGQAENLSFSGPARKAWPPRIVPNDGAVHASQAGPLNEFTPKLSAGPATPEWTVIEAGSGNKLDGKMRRIFGLADYSLADALAEAGCRPADVTHAIVTHLHFDHVGGLSCRAEGGGEPVPTFPNATVYVQRREWDDAIVNNSVMTRTYLRENLDPIREQVRLLESPMPFPPGYHPRRDEPPMTSTESRMVEVLPGIRVLAVPGHTWGQQAVLFTDERGRTVVFPADLLPTVHHVGAAYNMAYDVEPYTSTVTRRWFLEAAAANDWLLVLDHEPGNPCQRVKADGKGWFVLEAEIA